MAFAGMHNLRTLVLDDTGLIKMPLLNPIKSTLKSLYIHSNHISFVPSSYFQGFKQLQTLSFIKNAFRLVPDIVALHNTIVFLYLSLNDIHSIHGWLNKAIYPQLSELHLDNNVIREFDPNLLSYWPRLKRLNLARNRIEQLPTVNPEDDYKNCSQSKTSVCVFTFDRNPIHCDRALEGMITRRQKDLNNARISCNIGIGGLSQTVCYCPPYLRGRDLLTMGMWTTNSKDIQM